MIDVSMKALRGKLQADSSLLERVSRLWHVDLSSPPVWTRIEERMRDPCAARSVWEQLPPAERACLFQVVEASARRKGIPAERVIKKAKLPLDQGTQSISRLSKEWGLIDEGEVHPNPTAAHPHPEPVRILYAFRECGETLERTGMELFKSYADRSSLSLSHLLGQFDWNDLQRLADLCRVLSYPTGVPSSSSAWSSISHPADLRTRVASAFTQSLIAVELLGRLAPVVQRLYVWLCCEQRGKASMEAVRALLGGTEADLFAALHQLESHALAFDTLSLSGERWLSIPHDLFEVIERDVREQAAAEQTFALLPIATAPAITRDGQPGICYDLATAVGYVLQNDLELTKEGRLPRKAVSKIRPLLHGLPRVRELEGEMYVDQVFQLAQEMGLLRYEAPYGQEKACYLPGPALAAWEKLTLVDQVRRVLSEWKKSTTWYDLLPDGQPIYPSVYNAGPARKALLHHLLACLPGRWYLLDALLYLIWKEQPIPFSQATSRYDRQPPPPPSLRSYREQWMRRGAGQLYVGLLTSGLAEMGLVSLGYSCEPGTARAAREGAEWFQLTPLGAIVLSDGPVGEENAAGLWFTAEERALIVQPSFEVVVLQPAMPVLYQLIHWAEIKRLGPVSVLTLTKKALLRGMAAGYSVQQVLTQLSQMGRKELPQNVAYTLLNDWSRAYKGATLAEIILVETSSEQVALDLLRLLAENRIEARLLTPSTFAVFPGAAALPTLRRLLEKAGVFVREDPRADTHRWPYR